VPAEPSETSVVEHEVRVAASPETVFAYFTDPMRMVRWMGAEATLDPRPGGVCRIAFKPTRVAADFLDAPFGREQEEATARLEPSGVRVMTGEFVEVDPPRRIVLTWGWEQELYTMPPQSTAVEVVLTPEGESTIVRLAHRRLPQVAAPLHRAGWQHYLSRLAVAAAGATPGQDPWQVDDRG
jgi:uncharacterized protein YndB with AHSA1/START domain